MIVVMDHIFNGLACRLISDETINVREHGKTRIYKSDRKQRITKGFRNTLRGR